MLDLGCGTGMLLSAAGLLGATGLIGVDADPDALAQTIENLEKNDLQADLINCDVSLSPFMVNKVDTRISCNRRNTFYE